MGISANIKLINMHPPAMQVMQLWQVYLNNVDPLLKLTHTPTLQKRVIEACGKISSGLSVDEELEALLFSIYFISVNSLTEAETLASFGTPKSSLQARYHVASQQALLNVNLMRTLDLTVLQAYVLHLVSTIVLHYKTAISELTDANYRFRYEVSWIHAHITSSSALLFALLLD